MKVSERYAYVVNAGAETAADHVINLVGHGLRVLELGPGPGSILRPLVSQAACTVSAVEIDADCAESLREFCEQVVCADLEQGDWVSQFAGCRFDVIVLADVLEHLRDPWACLRLLPQLLVPGGRIVISMPNAAHHSIVAALLQGRFPYQERGLLDRTHLRFFGRADLEQMLFECGFSPSKWRFARQLPSGSELRSVYADLSDSAKQLLMQQEGGDIYQNIVEAFVADSAGLVAVEKQQVQDLKMQVTDLTAVEARLNLKVSELLTAHEQVCMELTSVHDAYQKQIKDNNTQISLLTNNVSSAGEKIDAMHQQYLAVKAMVETSRTARFMQFTKQITKKSVFLGYSMLPTRWKMNIQSWPLVRKVKERLGAASDAQPNFMLSANGARLLANSIDLPVVVPNALPDVFIWGVIDWHLRFQRPQQLALGFVRAGHRVIYISSELRDAARPGFSVETLPSDGQAFQIWLHVPNARPIYSALAEPALQRDLMAAVAMVLEWLGSPKSLSIVQHPFWLQVARSVPLTSLIYDCMDHHGGFANTAPCIVAEEERLMKMADLLVVTSGWLENIAVEVNENVCVIRNAGDYAHFSVRPEKVYQDEKGRKVLGYYGAIAEWFDIELVKKLAHQFPDCLILLIGDDTAGAKKALAHVSNIAFTGEVVYADLPYYLYGFDVCLLPFQVIELTLATNPVKVYEYLGSGKPVVSIDLPEIAQFGSLVYKAADHGEFIAQCKLALAETTQNKDLIDARQAFASQQTWLHRAESFDAALAQLHRPKVSVIVLTYNNLHLTKRCLASLERSDDRVDLEIIVVDNASSDQTPAYLQEYVTQQPQVRLLLNKENCGFAAGNNLGLAMATGDYLVVLNNDTVVTPGWAMGLVRHLQNDEKVGLVGPVTNNIGNESKINISYPSLEMMPIIAQQYTSQHLGQSLQIRTLAFFCVIMPRNVYEQVGVLDESFGLGFFEDDDYCRRVEQVGFKCLCAEDVFVHHNLSASFNKLGSERKQQLMERNLAIYEAKWGKWIPHQYRAK